MKNLFVALMALIILAAAGSSELPRNDYYAPFEGTPQSVTIVGAANDTIDLPDRLFDETRYAWQIQGEATGGKLRGKIIVRESVARGAYDFWVHRDSVTLDTAYTTTNVWLKGDYVYGLRQQLIIDGSGTSADTSSFTIRFVAKL